ncbi:MAG: YibE/F family protein, partial [Oscillospiraceae bacterium]
MFKDKKSILTFLITLILSISFIFIGYNYLKMPPSEKENEVYTATITDITEIKYDETFLNEDDTPIKNKTIFFEAKLTKGPEKGKIVQMSQYFDYLYVSQPKEIKKNERILVTALPDPETNVLTWTFVEHNRTIPLLVLLAVFLLIILIIGRGKGVATILSLALTTCAIFLLYIPSIFIGKNIYLSTIIITFFIILTSLILLNGLNKKAICAIIGNMGGVLVAGLLAIIMNKLLHITGIVDENYVYLMMMNPKIKI